MKTKILTIFLVLFIISNSFSQKELNDYKYVIVSKKFDFQKENDQYQLNSLTQFLFNKYGFIALMQGSSYPEDLIGNRCLALKAEVSKDSGMLKTKLKIELIDCNDKVVHTSNVGESRQKDYKKSYNEALRNAFKSIEMLNHKYKAKQENQDVVNTKKRDETSALINSKQEKITHSTSTKQVLYAQEIENGFQLVDKSPKLIYKMKRTGVNNVFLVEGKNAIIYMKNNNWILEYYLNNILKREILNIQNFN